jgi:uncharacterized membrane protein
MVVLWPDGSRNDANLGGLAARTEAGTVIGVDDVACPEGFAIDRCAEVSFEVRSGPDAGVEVSLFMADVIPGQGDRVRLAATGVPLDAGAAADVPNYQFSDFERSQPMLILALVFAAAVVALARWRGLRALVGLGASLLLIVYFLVPSILDGNPPLAVAIVGALAVMLITLATSHGVGPITVAAALGTATSLGVTAALALLFTEVAHITGFANEEASLLRATSPGLSIEGLLLAGIIIAALGVLDDVTISQASTVFALHRANPGLGFGGLFGGALTVGRDHITATVNTLVLAYVGASLPALLLFTTMDMSFTDAVNGELVAGNIVATLVGSIGLIAAVPLTTAIASTLARTTTQDNAATVHLHAH